MRSSQFNHVNCLSISSLDSTSGLVMVSGGTGWLPDVGVVSLLALRFHPQRHSRKYLAGVAGPSLTFLLLLTCLTYFQKAWVGFTFCGRQSNTDNVIDKAIECHILVPRVRCDESAALKVYFIAVILMLKFLVSSDKIMGKISLDMMLTTGRKLDLYSSLCFSCCFSAHISGPKLYKFD